MANKRDFATGIVSTAPSPALSGTSLVLNTGQGDRMPTVPFYATVHSQSSMPDLDTAEKVLVTARTGDTLTITRAQGDTTAKSIAAGWRLSNAIFAADIAKTLSDLTDDATHRLVTDTEKSTWNGKADGTHTHAESDIVNLTTDLASKVAANGDITGATKTKITYDAKGLVTSGADAEIADITGLQTALDGKQASLGFTPENVANKDTTITLGTSDTKYPSQKAVKSYVDAQTTMTQVRGETPSGTINGSNVTFTLASTPATGSERIYKNGIRLRSGSGNDYTISGSSITFTTAPATGSILLADYEVSTGTFTHGVNNFILNEVPTGLVNSSNTSYTTAQSYVGGTLQVYINGLKQKNSTHFTETTPASGVFAMSDAPLTGDLIEVSYQHTLSSAGNADTVDGFHASTTTSANKIPVLDSNGDILESMMPIQQSWQVPTLQNGWVNYDSGFETVGYMKDSLGFVHIKGFIKSGTTTSGTLIFTLPAGYRPGASTYVSPGTGAGGTINSYEITSSGAFNSIITNTTYSSLGHIVFRAEN